MKLSDKILLLQDLMYNATTSVTKPLNYFEARDTVLKYAEKTFNPDTKLSNLGYLPPAAIATINSVGFTNGDIQHFRTIHRSNNRELRSMASYLMEQSEDGKKLTIYDAEKEIRRVVLDGNPPKFPDYPNGWLPHHIHKIELVHVFEACHKDAVHAMVTEVNVPLNLAFREVVITSNLMLMTYPEQIKNAKKLMIEEAIRFINSGKGGIKEAANHLISILKVGQTGLTPEQETIAKIYPIFTQHAVSDKFKQELAEAYSMATVKKAALEVKESYQPLLTASVLPGVIANAGDNQPPLLLDQTPRTSETFHLPGSPGIGASTMMQMMKHVTDHALVYGASLVVVVGVLHCTNKLKYLNPVPAIARFCSSFWSNKQTQHNARSASRFNFKTSDKLHVESEADTDTEETATDTDGLIRSTEATWRGRNAQPF
jgi:hypothetical protein